jgi:hypothetical protein
MAVSGDSVRGWFVSSVSGFLPGFAPRFRLREQRDDSRGVLHFPLISEPFRNQPLPRVLSVSKEIIWGLNAPRGLHPHPGCLSKKLTESPDQRGRRVNTIVARSRARLAGCNLLFSSLLLLLVFTGGRSREPRCFACNGTQKAECSVSIGCLRPCYPLAELILSIHILAVGGEGHHVHRC